jgi:hypothetical protein
LSVSCTIVKLCCVWPYEPGSLVLLQVVVPVAPADDGARLLGDEFQAEVHLEEGEPLVDTVLHAGRVLLRVLGLRGVGVEADLLAVGAAQERVHRYAVGLAGQVPQGHLDAGHATAAPAVAAELLDALEQHLDVARVLAEQAGLEFEGVPLVRVVAHLAVAADALVGGDADDGTGERDPVQDGHPQVGDLELGGLGGPADVLGEVVDLLLDGPHGERAEAEAAQTGGRQFEQAASRPPRKAGRRFGVGHFVGHMSVLLVRGVSGVGARRTAGSDACLPSVFSRRRR